MFKIANLFLILIFVLNCQTIDNNTNNAYTDQQPISLLEKIKIGTTDQWLLSRGTDTSKPVLLIVHGGPGAASIGLARKFYGELEKHFIVVNWDQRGSGKSFTVFMDDVSPETYIGDTIEVIDYLREKFHVENIFLMGHSWGGYISAIVANRYPEKIRSLILIGPVIKAKKSLEISYNLVKTNPYTDSDLSKRASQLTFQEFFENRRYWLNVNCVGLFRGEHCHDESSYLSSIMYSSPEYNVYNIITYLPGIWKSSSRIRPYFLEMDLFRSVPEIKVPTHFMIGSHDYYNPLSIVKEFMVELKSPQKTLTVFEEFAHAPHFEDPNLFAEKLLTLIKND